MPNTPKGGGISRKIFNSSDRQKIKTYSIILKLKIWVLLFEQREQIKQKMK